MVERGNTMANATKKKKTIARVRKYSDGVYTYHNSYRDAMIANMEVSELRKRGWKVRTTKGADTGAYGYMAFDKPTIVWKRSNRRKIVRKRERK